MALLPVADIIYSVRTLSAAKSRTLLTMLGIIIGVMSVVAVASVGQSAQDLVLGEVQAVGANRISIFPGGSQENTPPPIVMGIVSTTLTERDYRAIRDLPHVVVGSPIVTSVASLTYKEKSFMVQVWGVGEEFPALQDARIASGRFFSRSDVESYGHLAVLGSKAATDLFGDEDPVNKTIRLKDAAFQVVGVLQERGSSIGQGQDSQIFIPVTTAQKLILGITYINAASVKVDASNHVTQAIDDIKYTLRRRHHITDPAKDDFSVRSADTAIGILDSITTVINVFLLVVTAISLVVGGINIMNIMYVAVRERTREVGLRKALGARSRRIFLQFLAESSMISLSGGLIGLALGAAIAYGITLVAVQYGLDWSFSLSVPAIAAALSVSTVIGLVFGVAPAMAAARLDAIRALRYE